MSKIKFLSGLISSEISPLGLYMDTFSLSSPGLFSANVCVLISSYKNTHHIESGPTHITSFYFNYLFKRLGLQIQTHSGYQQ